MKTQTIAKQSITLEAGQWYRASRPFAERGRKHPSPYGLRMMTVVSLLDVGAYVLRRGQRIL